MVPDRLRGRVMAVYSMMFMGMAPLGALVRRRAGGAARGAGDGRDRRRGLHRRRAHLRRRLPGLRGPARELIVAQQLAAGAPPDEATQLQE